MENNCDCEFNYNDQKYRECMSDEISRRGSIEMLSDEMNEFIRNDTIWGDARMFDKEC